MKRCLQYLVVFLLISPMIFQVSCKKEDSKNEDDRLDEIAVATLNGTSYGYLSLPYTEISGSIGIGKINNQEVKLIKGEDQDVGLFLPSLPEGSYALTVNDQTWKVNVKNQKSVEAASTIDPVFERIEEKFQLLSEAEGFEENELDDMIAFKAAVVKLYNGLTATQKKEVAQYYLANKSQIEALSKSSVASASFQSPQLLASSSGDDRMNTSAQSGCNMHTTFKEFYNCQCAAQAAAYQRMAPQLGTALKMLAGAGAVAGVSLSLSALGPAALGIAAVGISLPLATAMYIIFVEIGPDIKEWLIATRRIIKSPWIMRDDLFSQTNSLFKDGMDVDINVQLGYRTLNSTDVEVVSNSRAFLSVYQSASAIWNKIATLAGDLPGLTNAQNRTPLKDGELAVSEISDNSVRLLRQNKGILTFESVDGGDHDFSFVATVNAEGFTKKETIQATITSKDSSDIYKISLAGTYRVQNYKGNSPNAELYADITMDGKVVYRIYNDISWPNGATFHATWGVTKVNGKYYYSENGFWHYGFGSIEIDFPLRYPVTSFRFHNETTYSK